MNRKTSAFTILELILVLTMLGFLVALHLPAYSRLRERTYITIDQSNIRQILRGSALYSSDNDDHLAHPTWGSDLTGPDGWAYATQNKGRIPDTPNTPQSCAGRDVNSVQFTNQVKFFKIGQVGQYLPDVKTAWCPKDAANRHSGRLRQLWIGRPVKVTSYCWTGTIGGFIGPRAENLNNKTYKVSRFLPTDWQMWEQNDNDPFYFNDAGNNPQAAAEVVSLRHTGLKQWWTFAAGTRRKLPGGAMVGTFGGDAKFVAWPRVFDLIYQKVPYPNELLNGPGFQR